jgi:hypothetical protein
MMFDGLPSAETARAADAHPPELAAELDGMGALVQTLKQVPAEAWETELGPMTSRRAQAPGRNRRRLSRVRQGGHQPLRSPVRLGLGALVATGLAAAFLVGSLTHPTLTGTGRVRPVSSGSAARVVLRPLPQTSGSGLAVAYMRGSERMSLRVRRLPPSPPGTYYELWLMTSDTDLVSVASFRVSGTGTADLNLALPAQPSNYEFLDISLQRVSAGATISQDNVLRGVI